MCMPEPKFIQPLLTFCFVLLLCLYFTLLCFSCLFLRFFAKRVFNFIQRCTQSRCIAPPAVSWHTVQLLTTFIANYALLLLFSSYFYLYFAFVAIAIGVVRRHSTLLAEIHFALQKCVCVCVVVYGLE